MNSPLLSYPSIFSHIMARGLGRLTLTVCVLRAQSHLKYQHLNILRRPAESTYQEILKTHFFIVSTCLGISYLLRFVNSSVNLPLKQKSLNTSGIVLLALSFMKVKPMILARLYIYSYYIHNGMIRFECALCTCRCTDLNFVLASWVLRMLYIYTCHII